MKNRCWSVLTAVTAMVALAACSLPWEEEAVGSAPSETLQGAALIVSSKGTTESILLGKIAATVLSAHGADVVDKTEVNDTVDTRSALTAGKVDMYWEYTTTAWLEHQGNGTPITDPVRQFQDVQAADANLGIAWLNPAPLNNTEVLAVAGDKAEELKVASLSGLADLAGKEPVTFCLQNESPDREDYLAAVSENYGLKVAKPATKRLKADAIYDAVAEGKTCTFGEVKSTDSRIAEFGLQILTDDQRVFPLYNPALTMRQETIDRYPEIAERINPVAAELDDATITELNARVEADGADPGAVAESWLTEKGLI